MSTTPVLIRRLAGTLLAFAISGVTVHPSAAPAATPLAAKLSWSMPPRYNASWSAFDADLDRYAPSIVTTSFRVDLNGCPSTAPGGKPDAYMWAVTDAKGTIVATTGAGCQVSFTGPEGAYRATLTVRKGSKLSSTKKTLDVKDQLIVAFGDSLNAGEGNPDIPGAYVPPLFTPEVWKDQTCHRSARSAPAIAAERLENSGPGSVTFLSFACSGAETNSGLLGPYGGMESGPTPLPAQVDQALMLLCGTTSMQQPCPASAPKVDAVFLSIGVNDLGFSGIIEYCATPQGELGGDGGCHENSQLVQQANTGIYLLGSQLERLKLRLIGPLALAKVFVVSYPEDPFDARYGGEGCGSGTPIDEGLQYVGHDEAVWLRSLGKRLNAALRASARQHDWIYIAGISDGFRHRGYCSGSPWFVSLDQSYFWQGDQNGTLHPNAAGHAFIAKRYVEAFKAPWKPRAWLATAFITFESIKVTDPLAVELSSCIINTYYVRGWITLRADGVTGTRTMGFDEGDIVGTETRPFPNGGTLNLAEYAPTLVVALTDGNALTVDASTLLEGEGQQHGPLFSVSGSTDPSPIGPNPPPTPPGCYASPHAVLSRSDTYKAANSFGAGLHTVTMAMGNRSVQLTYRIEIQWNPKRPHPPTPGGPVGS